MAEMPPGDSKTVVQQFFAAINRGAREGGRRRRAPVL